MRIARQYSSVTIWWSLGWRWVGRIGLSGLGRTGGLGQTGGIEEALEFGGEPDASEFVGHPDVGDAAVGLLDARTEIAGWGDVAGWSADDAGEEFVDFTQFQGDAGGAGLLDGFDTGGDGFPAQETTTAGGPDASVLRAVDIHVGLGGVFTRSNFLGEGFVLWVG